MQIELVATATIQAEPATVFALATDGDRFPALFDGCGPIPALRRIRLRSPLAVGCIRDVDSSDGARICERVTALDPPHHHGYRLERLPPPLAWLVRHGDADWTFTAAGAATAVRWRYRWLLTHGLAWPVAMPLLRGFMQRAMQRCLTNMAATLHPPANPRST